MPSVTVYNHGTSGGTPGMNNGKSGPRGDIGGWTAASSRRNMQFLWAVDARHLTGTGYSFTLTIRDCPATPKDWATWCATYWKRVVSDGALRIHWVIEWQRRGCPHLHGSVYFPEAMSHHEVHNVLLDSWVHRNPYEPSRAQQRCLPIFDIVGWSQYVAKHAARGVQHYQRAPENIPQHWKGTTGRMWGSRGDWPRTAPVRLHLQDQHGDGGWHAFRRLVRSYAVASAKLKGDRAAQIYARRMLSSNRRDLAECRGIAAWVPRDVIERFMENLDGRGFSIQAATPAEGGGAENGLSTQSGANGFSPVPPGNPDASSQLELI